MTQAEAYVEVVKSVADAIRALGSVPSGHLYANSCMQFMTLNTYTQIIETLKTARLVEEHNHLLTWVGPDAKEAK